jgi:hypothetical protein
MAVMPVVPMPAMMAMPTVMAVPAAMVVPTPMPVPAHFGGNIFRILLNGRRSARIAERQRLSLLSGSSDHEQSSNHRKTQNFRSLHPQFSFTSCFFHAVPARLLTSSRVARRGAKLETPK